MAFKLEQYIPPPKKNKLKKGPDIEEIHTFWFSCVLCGDEFGVGKCGADFGDMISKEEKMSMGKKYIRIHHKGVCIDCKAKNCLCIVDKRLHCFVCTNKKL